MNDQAAVVTKSYYILDWLNSFLNYSFCAWMNDQLDKITWNLKYDSKMDPLEISRNKVCPLHQWGNLIRKKNQVTVFYR